MSNSGGPTPSAGSLGVTAAIQHAELSAFGILPWLLLAFASPVYASTINASEGVFALIHTCGAWAVGSLMLRRVPGVTAMNQVLRSGLSILVGSVSLYSLVLLPVSEPAIQPLLVIAECGALLVATRMRVFQLRRYRLTGIGPFLVAAAVSCVLSIDNGDLVRAESRVPIPLETRNVIDAPYFTSLVATLKSGSPGSAIFEDGSTLSYSILGAIPPAALSAASSAPSHVSLWGMWMPVYKVLGLLLIAAIVGRLVGNSQNVEIGAVLLFVFLQPLHPQYVLTGDVAHFVWAGIGFLGAGHNLPTTAGIVWAGLALSMSFPAFPKPHASRDYVLLCVALALLPAAKVTLFFCVVAALGTAAAIRALRKDWLLAKWLGLGVAIGAIVYVVCYAGDRRQVIVSPGFLPQYFAGLIDARLPDTSGMVLGAVVGIALTVIWGGIRFPAAGALLVARDEPAYTGYRRQLVLGTMVALLSSLVLASIARIEVRGAGGALAASQDFNLLQFPRAAFFLVSIVGAAGMIVWIKTAASKLARIALGTVATGWCLVSALGLLYDLRSPRPRADEWYSSATSELAGSRPVLAAVNPDYEGSLSLVATEVGRFWVSQEYLNMTARNSYRWLAYADALSDNLRARSAACRLMRREGVEAIVGTPEDSAQVGRFANECDFERPRDQRWVWVRKGEKR